MAGAGVRDRLYGPGRTLPFREIQQEHTTVSVKRPGDYNLPDATQWGSVTKDTYVAHDINGKKASQPSHVYKANFMVGNDSGKHVPARVFRTSETAEQFIPHRNSKREPMATGRGSNWPDMAPELREGATTDISEYGNNFKKPDGVQPPEHPKLRTSSLRLPIDRPNPLNETSVALGYNSGPMKSAVQAAFEETPRDGPPSVSRDVMKNMMKMTRNSSVFRRGDYNNLRPENYESTTASLYGHKTPANLKLALDARRSRTEGEVPRTAEGVTGVGWRDGTAATTHREGQEGRSNQETAHFKFGSSQATRDSEYSGNFFLTGHQKQPFAPPLQNSQVMHQTSDQTEPERTSYSVAYSSATHAMAKPPKFEKTPYGANFELSYYPNAWQDQRMRSMAASSYVAGQERHRPAAPAHKSNQFNFIKSDQSLPGYAAGSKTSEAKENFMGEAANGSHSERVRVRDEIGRARFLEMKAEHFRFGYDLLPKVTESQKNFTGSRADQETTPAGTEQRGVSWRSQPHLAASSNVADTPANDPHRTDAMEQLRARLGVKKQQELGRPVLSVQQADYNNPTAVTMTDPQQRQVRQCNTILAVGIAPSHLFHTDSRNESRHDLLTTARQSYIRPENREVPAPLQ